jgi:hypothetical protein
MSGTVVGSLAEWSVVATLCAVAVGDAGAVTCWTFLFSYVQGFSETYGKWLPVGLLAALILAFAGSRLWKAYRHRKGEPKRRPATESGRP